MLFDPRVIFISLWTIELVAQFLFGGIFGSFANETWGVIAITIIAFLLGAQLIESKVDHSVVDKINLIKQIERFFAKNVSSGFIYITLLLFVIAAFFAIQKLFIITGVDSTVLRPPECLRLKIIHDLISDREIAPILKLFTFGIAICIFYLSDVKNSTKFQIYFIIVLGLFFVFATTGRLMLLMLFSAVTYLLYMQKAWGLKEIFFSVVSFVLLFFIIAIALNKQTADWSKNINPCTSKNCIVQEIFWQNTKTQIINKRSQSSTSNVLTIQDKLVWNAQNYLMGSLAAFNHFVATGSPSIEGGATLPNIIRKAINLTGANVKMRPAVNPYVITPLQSNTYTAIFPIYHDMGKLGVLVWFFMLGILHQFLYKLSQFSAASIYKYFYAISIYPLCMIIFEEAYISSLGFWAIFLVTPALLQLLNIGWAKLVMFQAEKK
ncbi:MAG: O-antigen polymerase [Pseudomonadota bacterium]